MPKRSTIQRLKAGEITEEQALSIYAEGHQRRKLNMMQNQKALVEGTKTEADLWEESLKDAEDSLRNALERVGEEASAEKGISLTPAQISDYRMAREELYKELYEYNDANDLFSLMNLAQIETQIYINNWELAKPNLKPIDRQKYQEALAKLVESHTKLQKEIGIDKKSRDNAKANKSPIEKFEEQMRRAHVYRMSLLDNFPVEADNVTMEEGEKELRELIKARLGFRFALVDAIIRNIKRLNGLEPTVETYD